jgi:hypothetical protein
VPAGFPPIWRYQLDQSNETVDPAAMRSVAFERQRLADSGDVRWLEWVCYAHGRAARCAWLCAFGGKATRAACARTWTHDVPWSNAADLRRLVARDQDPIARDFEAMVRELLRSRALLRDDAKTAKPNVFVVLHDLRGDTSEALPQPDSLLAARKVPPRVTLQ